MLEMAESITAQWVSNFLLLLMLIATCAGVWLGFDARRIKMRGQCDGDFGDSNRLPFLKVSATNRGDRVATIHSICIENAAGRVFLGEYAELSKMSNPLPIKLAYRESAVWLFMEPAPVVRKIVDQIVETKKDVKSLKCVLCDSGGEKISSFNLEQDLIQTICKELEAKK